MSVKQRTPQSKSNKNSKVNHNRATLNGTDQSPPSQALHRVSSRPSLRTRLRTIGFVLLLQLFIAFSVGGSTVAPIAVKQGGMAAIIAPWNFNLLAWEADALWQKMRAFAMQPAHALDYETSVSLVHEYLARSQKMQELEQEIGEQLTEKQPIGSRPNTIDSVDKKRMQQYQEELEALRIEQSEKRSTVEQIIERQISHELAGESLTFLGEPFPPVQFTFVEPPRKLVVSPRDHITTDFSRMLDATMSIEQIEKAEQAYWDWYNSSAYITNIGGLGAFPTMVVDRASLEWILSTVAHEWTHNYLTLFPLGINYMTNADFIIMNETVAEIVGNELGEQTLRKFYPDIASTLYVDEGGDDELRESERLPLTEEPPFDFRKEMQETRLVVDKLLALGKIEDAEQYMEIRRLYFVENGYALRVLNQGYFAFHGSYGTSAASTSPIGPQLEALRGQSADLKTFLETVRTFTSPDDITQALAKGNQQNNRDDQ